MFIFKTTVSHDYIKNLASIVLFVYNRPNHTRMTIEALQKNHPAKDSILYIFADGAKTSANEEQIASVQQTRDYIKTVAGFKEVVIEEAQQNKGLANSVIYGVTKVINQYGKVIVVEDDIVTHRFFVSVRILGHSEFCFHENCLYLCSEFNFNSLQNGYNRTRKGVSYTPKKTKDSCCRLLPRAYVGLL